MEDAYKLFFGRTKEQKAFDYKVWAKLAEVNIYQGCYKEVPDDKLPEFLGSTLLNRWEDPNSEEVALQMKCDNLVYCIIREAPHKEWEIFDDVPMYLVGSDGNPIPYDGKLDFEP